MLLKKKRNFAAPLLGLAKYILFLCLTVLRSFWENWRQAM